MQGMKGLALLMLVSLGALLLAVVSIAGAEGATITVPDDYPTINSAIENATDYDTLFIKDGNYTETVVIWRPLTVMGESRDGTIIWSENPFAVLMVSHKTSLSRLTVGGTTVGAGLILQATGCTVEDVTIKESLWGLWVNRGDNNVIRDVDCVDNQWQGLLVEEADHNVFEDVECVGNNEGAMARAAIDNTFRNCSFLMNRNQGFVGMMLEAFYANNGLVLVGCEASGNNGTGIEVQYFDRVTVDNCTVDDNGMHGIYFTQCNDVTVRGCIVRNFERLGIGYSGQYDCRGCLIEGNYVEHEEASWTNIMVRRAEDCLVIGNTVRCVGSGISVYEANHTVVEDNTVVGVGDDPTALTHGMTVERPPGGSGLAPHDVTLRGNVVSGFHDGIWARGAKDLVISDCTFTDCVIGVNCEYVPNWGDKPFDGGEVTDCLFEGCGLDLQGMEGVTVMGNTISGAAIGIRVNATAVMVDGNLFTGNVIRDCTQYGVFFNSTNGTNTFSLNAFIGNARDASDPDPMDMFDDGKYGNYWDDYEERYPGASVNGDVWDTPYAVNGSAVMDRFPLVYEYDTEPPVADAGEDRTVEAGGSVTLDGTGSTDDHVILNYTWYVEGHGGSPEVLHGPMADLAFVFIGRYEVQLTVRDAWGNIGTDTLVIQVEDHEAPAADAGNDIEVGMGEELVLDGTASSDNGVIVAYKWTVSMDGFERVVEGAIVTLNIERPGDYTMTLSVRDEANNTGSDTLTVRVTDTEPPVADAGPDIEYRYTRVRLASLNGSRSSDNVGIDSWTWILINESEQLIGSSEQVYYTFYPGTHHVRLLVRDMAGNNDTDEVVIHVWDGVPPYANAGEDIIVNEGTNVTFNGTGSDDSEGEIVEYQWCLIIEGEIVNLFGPTPSYIFAIPGTYLVILFVRDEGLNTDMDRLKVTVLSVEEDREWRIGPFKDVNGPLGGVRVEAVFNGTSIVAYTDDGGTATFTVPLEDLTSPVAVSATKEGWEDLDFDVTLDASGDPTGTVPVMQGQAMDGGGGEDDDDELDDWLPWGLVVILIVAYAGTLLYLSSVAKRAGGE